MRAMKRFSWSVVAVALLASSHAQAQEPPQPAKGLALAQQVCVACHAIDKRQVQSPNPAAPRFEVIANSPGISELALGVALRTSHRSMPNVILEADEIRNVAAYILSLK
jgi:mono/diheme cytochrome c family protein